MKNKPERSLRAPRAEKVLDTDVPSSQVATHADAPVADYLDV